MPLERGFQRKTFLILVSGSRANRNVNHARSVTSSSYACGSMLSATMLIRPEIWVLRCSIHSFVKSAIGRGSGYENYKVMEGAGGRQRNPWQRLTGTLLDYQEVQAAIQRSQLC